MLELTQTNTPYTESIQKRKIVDSQQGYGAIIIISHTSDSTANLFSRKRFPPKYYQNLETLNAIRQFEKNWNGYGAEPIPDHIIEKVRTILPDIEKQPDIFPTGRKSIQLEYEKPNNDYLEFEFFEDKIIMYREWNGVEEEREIDFGDVPENVLQFYAE